MSDSGREWGLCPHGSDRLLCRTCLRKDCYELSEENRKLREQVSALSAQLNSGMPGAPLDQEHIDQIRDRCSRATPGPWVDTSTSSDIGSIHLVVDYVEICQDPYMDDRKNDRTFIANSRQDIEDLLAHVDFLTGLLRDDNGAEAYRQGRERGRKEALELCDSILTQLEWGPCPGIPSIKVCSICGGEWLKGGHTATCRLANILKNLRT